MTTKADCLDIVSRLNHVCRKYGISTTFEIDIVIGSGYRLLDGTHHEVSPRLRAAEFVRWVWAYVDGLEFGYRRAKAGV